MSPSTLAVLRVLMDAGDDGAYGLEVGKAAEVASGTLYPILDRLEQAGLVRGEWEQSDAKLGRPRRRTYVLTADGHRQSRTAILEAAQRMLPAGLRPNLLGGTA